jgi:3-oxoacyl-[acyl-carrier protein] reductase
MDSAFKKIISFAGIKSAKLLRRSPVNSASIKPLPSTNDILSGINVATVNLDQKEFNSSLSASIMAANGIVTGDGSSFDAVVCDARSIERPDNLSSLHTVLNPLLAKLKRNGRVILIGGDILTQKSPALASVAGGLCGFTRSIAKEIAAKGCTANMIQTPLSMTNSEASIAGLLQFLLSNRSSFINGQVIPLSENPLSPTFPDVCQQFSVRDKRVVVTGAARGIGEYTTRLYHSEGAKLLLIDHPSMEPQLKSLAGTLGCSYLAIDVTANDTPYRIIDCISKTFTTPSIDIMIHNAGITRDKSFKHMTSANFNSVIDVNLASIVRTDEMLLDGQAPILAVGGKMLYLSSIGGVAGNFGQTNYSASKSGIIG